MTAIGHDNEARGADRVRDLYRVVGRGVGVIITGVDLTGHFRTVSKEGPA